MTASDSLKRPNDPVLVVDWGGVLTFSMQDGFDAWMAAEAIDTKTFMVTMGGYHNTADSPLHRRERGEITVIEFEEELAANLRTVAGGTVSAQDLLDRMFAHITINQDMIRIVDAARDHGWLTGLLSNAWGAHYDDELIARFDAFVLSDKIGVRKPDPAAFEAVVEALDVRPDQCVFVDDMWRNIAAAKEIGMQVLRYTPGVERELHYLITGTDNWVAGTP